MSANENKPAIEITTVRTEPDSFGNFSQRGDKRFLVEGSNYPQYVGRITKTRDTIFGTETEGDAYSFAGPLVIESSGRNDGIHEVPVLPNGSTISIDGELFTVHTERYQDQITLKPVV